MPLLRFAHKRLPETGNSDFLRLRKRVLILVTTASEIELAHWRKVLNTTVSATECAYAVKRVPGLCAELGIDCVEEMKAYSARYYYLEHMRRAQAIITRLRDPIERLAKNDPRWYIEDLRRRLRFGKFTLAELSSSKDELDGLIRQYNRDFALRYMSAPYPLRSSWTEEETCRHQQWLIQKYKPTSAELTSAQKASTESVARVIKWLTRTNDILYAYELVEKGRAPYYWAIWEPSQVHSQTREHALTLLPKILEFIKTEKIRLGDLGLTKRDITRLRNRLKLVPEREE